MYTKQDIINNETYLNNSDPLYIHKVVTKADIALGVDLDSLCKQGWKLIKVAPLKGFPNGEFVSVLKRIK